MFLYVLLLAVFILQLLSSIIRRVISRKFFSLFSCNEEEQKGRYLRYALLSVLARASPSYKRSLFFNTAHEDFYEDSLSSR